MAFPLPFCFTHHIWRFILMFTLIFSLYSMCSFLLFHYSSLFIVSFMPAEEVQKLQKHLALLRQEYVKMQQKLVETDRRCSVLAAQASLPGSVSQASDSFISRLLAIVADLFKQEQYRWELDMNAHILLDEMLGECKPRNVQVIFNPRSKRNKKKKDVLQKKEKCFFFFCEKKIAFTVKFFLLAISMQIL